MTKETKLRIKELQQLARTARYNIMLTEKRLNTAKRNSAISNIDDEQLALDCWWDTYQIAKEDIYTYGGA
jgi:hypothetical protein